MANSKLAAELKDDPESLGYAGKSAAAILALMRVKDRDRVVESITGRDLFEASTEADRDKLTDAQKACFHALIGMEAVWLTAENTAAALLVMFPAESQTGKNLAAAGTEKISRLEELGLAGIRQGHVERALSTSHVEG
jgi:hypothetical protein